MTGSNRRPSRCKRDALPAELTARGSQKLNDPGFLRQAALAKQALLRSFLDDNLKGRQRGLDGLLKVQEPIALQATNALLLVKGFLQASAGFKAGAG